MDLSKEYIKMCDCEEIQKNHKFNGGDFYLKEAEVRIDDDNEYPAPDGSIWLPRQDQLQEMIEKPTLGAATSLELLFTYFIDNVKHYNTWEKLWLAYLMKEKHNKTWDKNKWKNI